MSTQPQTNNNLPNPVLLARQIDGIREVVLRMRTAQNTTVNTLIQQKLQIITEH
ncbi:MAG: hypothetical protein KJ069_00305 [Anaerolineae bacterium]|nr:hypothetical protein [Anaerolineae bacterium]